MLFGGEHANGALGDTWVYDYAATTWMLMDPRNPPGPRDHALMAYDSHAKGVMLIGGSFDDDRFFIYRHRENEWHAVNPSGDLPVVGDHMQGASNGTDFVIYGGFRGGPGPQRSLGAPARFKLRLTLPRRQVVKLVSSLLQ